MQAVIHGFMAMLDSFLYRLSVYGGTVLVILSAAVVVVLFPSQFNLEGASALELSALQQDDVQVPMTQIMADLASVPPIQSIPTRLSESPFWFATVVSATGQSTILELPSRHAVEAACWNAADFSPLGAATRSWKQGDMMVTKTGFALDLGVLPAAIRVLCRATHTGPAYISAIAWPEEAFKMSEKKFHRNAGLLNGGMLVLAMFALMVSIIKRDWVYLLFTLWLIANLRLASVSAGWDVEWLGYAIPPEWLIVSRKVSLSMAFSFNVMMFSKMFAKELNENPPLRLWGQTAQLTCIPVLLAMLLPYRQYLPVIWVSGSVMGISLCYLLARILITTKSKVAFWYGMGMAMVILTWLYEVAAAAFGVRQLIGEINSVTGALLSSVCCALAIVENIGQERQSRLDAQAELHNIYEVVPVGLFSLSETGRIIHVNGAYRHMMGDFGKEDSPWRDGFESGAWERLQAFLNHPVDHDFVIKDHIDSDGQQRSYLVRAARINDQIEGSLQDITTRVEAVAKLQFLADHDSVTGILNRRGLSKIFDTVNHARLDHDTMTLAYLDLDQLALVNHMHGSLAGDAVLKMVCKIINDTLTEHQVLGRMGGDKFAIIFQGGTLEEAALLCERVKDNVARDPFKLAEHSFRIHCSIGLVPVPFGGNEEAAMRLAEEACYAHVDEDGRLKRHLEQWRRVHEAEALAEGWSLFQIRDEGIGFLDILRHPDAAIFPDDFEVWKFVVRRATHSPVSAATAALNCLDPAHRRVVLETVSKQPRLH
ncbi:MAG: diguanylate cyclase [Proteobacteria bacterium]|nr:diguanylate cyclase [Pseudomonadota bacterium]